jgi:hypothetical protein
MTVRDDLTLRRAIVRSRRRGLGLHGAQPRDDLPALVVREAGLCGHVAEGLAAGKQPVEVTVRGSGGKR